MTDVSLGFERNHGETWRDAVKRVASRYGLEQECLETFDDDVEHGEPEDRAAWAALYEWDVLDLYIDGKKQP
jgi:hypothetical protein